MEEIQRFLIRLGIAFVGALLVGSATYGTARRKGRDTIGWFLLAFFPALVGFLLLLLTFPERMAWSLSGVLGTLLAPGVLLALPGIETPGQTKRCRGCGRLIAWRREVCPACGAPAGVPERGEGERIKRPLRTCFLYTALFILLVLIVFGLIGYFCVPNEPRAGSPQPASLLDGPKENHANRLGLGG